MGSTFNLKCVCEGKKSKNKQCFGWTKNKCKLSPTPSLHSHETTSEGEFYCTALIVWVIELKSGTDEFFNTGMNDGEGKLQFLINLMILIAQEVKYASDW